MSMSQSATPGTPRGPSRPAGRRMGRGIVIGGIVVVLVAAIALDTKVVRVGSKEDTRQAAFDPDSFGKKAFPKIQTMAEKNAPDAATLAKALLSDKAAAVKKYGTQSGAFPILPVKLSGTVGKGTSGIYEVTVPDMPDGVKIRVQTGPAINGTSLRDYPGTIAFGDFKNQIQYQNAGAGINRAMSAATLNGLDRKDLQGKTLNVTGVFTLINPKNWLVTPVKLEVGK